MLNLKITILRARLLGLATTLRRDPPVIGEWESTVQWRCHVRADGLMISGSFMIYMYIVYVRIYIYHYVIV